MCDHDIKVYEAPPILTVKPLVLFNHDTVMTRNPTDQRDNYVTVRAHTPLTGTQKSDKPCVLYTHGPIPPSFPRLS